MYNADKIFIGTQKTALYRGFNGSISDVMIFNRTLSAEEVYNLYRYNNFDYGIKGEMTLPGAVNYSVFGTLKIDGEEDALSPTQHFLWYVYKPALIAGTTCMVSVFANSFGFILTLFLIVTLIFFIRAVMQYGEISLEIFYITIGIVLFWLFLIVVLSSLC
jgi:hypothetical protein